MSLRYSDTRFQVTAWILGLAFLAVFGRLVWIQVVRAEDWQKRALLHSTDVEEVAGRRGRIFDRNGILLAWTEYESDVGISRPEALLKSDALPGVARLLEMSDKELRSKLLGRTEHTVVARGLQLDDHTRNQLRALHTFSFTDRHTRRLPHGEVAMQLLGTVNRPGEGVSGLERVFDEALSGVPGRERLRRDAQGNLHDRIVLEAPVHGSDVVASIDLRIQSILEREVEVARVKAGAFAAQGLVLDPTNGDVLGLAQMPRQTPSASGAGSVGKMRVMGATDLFEPGSVFKIFSAAALLSKSLCDTSTIYDGEGHPEMHRAKKVFPGGRIIRDVHPVGEVSLRHAFVTSSNIIYATAVMERLRRKEFHSLLANYGLTERPGPGFRAETSGYLRELDAWTDYMMPSLAIGQAISVSLLQLGTSFAAMIGDGDLYAPRFATRVEAPNGTVELFPAVVRRHNVVPPDVIPRLRAMCRDAVELDYGTGGHARVANLSIGGKTGTAQVSNDNGYIDGIYTPSFVGFVPAEQPRLLVAVVLHGAPGETTYGGNTAAPAFANVVREIASRTSYLDSAIQVADVAPIALEPAPRLVGRTAAELRQDADKLPWELPLDDVRDDARVVGQLPAPGTPVPAGARIQLAWMETH